MVARAQKGNLSGLRQGMMMLRSGLKMKLPKSQAFWLTGKRYEFNIRDVGKVRVIQSW